MREPSRKGLAGRCSAGLVLQGLKALSNSCSWAVLASADLNKTLQVPGAGACSGFDVLTKLGYVT